MVPPPCRFFQSTLAGDLATVALRRIARLRACRATAKGEIRTTGAGRSILTATRAARRGARRAFSKQELLEELARRHADEVYRDGMTMTDMELAVEKLKVESGDPGIEAMLKRMKPEKPTGKACPRCGKRIPVNARDRERTVRSVSGPITFKTQLSLL